LTQPTGLTGTITPKAATLTINYQPDVIYGATITPVVTPTGLVGGDNLTGSLEIWNDDPAIVGPSDKSSSDHLIPGDYTVEPGTIAINDGNGGNNYSGAFPITNDAFSISKRTLTYNVTVSPSKLYNGSDTAAHTGGLTNVVSGDFVTLDAALHYTNGPNAQIAGPIDPTAWSISGLDAGYYILPPFVTQHANITMVIQPQYIYYPEPLPEVVYITDDSCILNAVATSGLPVKYSLRAEDEYLAELVGNKIVFKHHEGTIIVTAYVDPHPSFLDATPVLSRIRIVIDMLDPVITRSVTIPPLSDASTSPIAGTYHFPSGSDFVFNILPTDGRVPVITTGRQGESDGEDFFMLLNPDGSYTVRIMRIRQNLVLSIATSGTDNTDVSLPGDKVWSFDADLYISADAPEARIYNLAGVLIKVQPLLTDETTRIPLERGLYFVVVNGKTWKVIIK
jgi:hypothetical protein